MWCPRSYDDGCAASGGPSRVVSPQSGVPAVREVRGASLASLCTLFPQKLGTQQKTARANKEGVDRVGPNNLRLPSTAERRGSRAFEKKLGSFATKHQRKCIGAML